MKLPLVNPGAAVKVDEVYLPLLIKLFPGLQVTSEFTTHSFLTVKDISSKKVLDNLHCFCTNYIVVSSVMFDFELTLEDFIELSLAFRAHYFKSRFKTLEIPSHFEPSEFLQDYIYGLAKEDDYSLLELFDSVGSRSFPEKFFRACQDKPTPVVIKSLVTFLLKTREGVGSLFYKKSHLRLNHKIESNLKSAGYIYNKIHKRGMSSIDSQLTFLLFHNRLFNL